MSRKHFYRALVAVLTITLSVSATAQAASLHFIAFSETLDTNIGTVEDLQRITAWANTIASHTGLTLQFQSLSGSNLTPNKARQMLNSISPGEDDVVCFIYTGHGANAGNSNWPTFTFLTHTGNPYVTFDEVVATLQPKPQRMLMVLSDCCNVFSSGSGHITPPIDPSAASARTIANYQNLFLNFRGTIRATAAKVGQYSLGSSGTGGLFTNAFLDELDSLANTITNLTWDAVLTAAATSAKDTATYFISLGGLGSIAAQEALFVIDLEQVGASVPEDPNTTDEPDDTNNTSNTGGTTTTGSTPTVAACGPMGPGLLAMSVACWGAMLVCRRNRR